MGETVIAVDNIRKRYVIGGEQPSTFGEVLSNAALKPFRAARSMFSRNGARPEERIFWALKGVSFEVKRGEILGVIGRNGAGKSTLLKILSRITDPTVGRVEIRGRVGCLLEVGTGFHPELTGRENIFLNGSILGLRKADIQSRFDGIVAFAEVEQFIDTAVKYYSSGMYLRLAFSVAAHLEPEILIVDEVLAVGDAAFQKKCLGKMQDVSKAGRTVLFVSHNMAAVQQLTQKCMLLNQGEVEAIGPSSDVIARYFDDAEERSVTVYEVGRHGTRLSGLPRTVELVSLELLEHTNKMIESGDDFVIQVKVRAHADVSGMKFSFTIFRSDSMPVGTCFGPEAHSIKRGEEKSYEIRLRNCLLAPGKYHVGLAVGTGSLRTQMRDFDIVLEVLHFEVINHEEEGAGQLSWNSNWGAIRFDPPSSVEVPACVSAISSLSQI